jgi:hypothetical protein
MGLSFILRTFRFAGKLVRYRKMCHRKQFEDIHQSVNDEYISLSAPSDIYIIGGLVDLMARRKIVKRGILLSEPVLRHLFQGWIIACIVT